MSDDLDTVSQIICHILAQQQHDSDQHVSLIVHEVYERMVLILKCFHSRNSEISKLAVYVFVSSSLEFASRPSHGHLIATISLT